MNTATDEIKPWKKGNVSKADCILAPQLMLLKNNLVFFYCSAFVLSQVGSRGSAGENRLILNIFARLNAEA